MNAAEDSAALFGKDCKAGTKRIKDLESAAQDKISKVAVEEMPAFTAMHKRVHSIMQLHTAFLDHGLDSGEFKACWQSMETWCSLEPKAAWQHPAWMHGLIHRQNIAGITAPKMWFEAIGIDRLTQTGSATPEMDQAQLLLQKMAMCLKHPTKEEVAQRLRTYFNFDNGLEDYLGDSVGEFATGYILACHLLLIYVPSVRVD